MKKPGMRGKTEASTTRRPRHAVDAKVAVEHAALVAAPIAQVHEAWWPQALSRT